MGFDLKKIFGASMFQPKTIFIFYSSKSQNYTPVKRLRCVAWPILLTSLQNQSLAKMILS